jgi:agmatine/peptidylarginine deiminase
MKNKKIIGLSSLLFDTVNYKVGLSLIKIFTKNKLPFELLENTKDIWARDYMPILTSKNNIVGYNYNPNYLVNNPQLKTNIKNVTVNSKQIRINKMSKLVLDGGNFVYLNDTAILTDKIYTENTHISTNKEYINNIIKNDFDINHIIILPQIPFDEYGHTDSMVRFIDNNTLLVNDFSYESESYNKKLAIALQNTNMKLIYLKYSSSFFNTNRNWGAYLNYLEFEETIIVPLYNIEEDKKVLKQFKTIFPNKCIEGIVCNDIIKLDGALNCISSIYFN